MRVIFLSDHFSTPYQPGILRTWQLSKYLCEQGDEVVVIAPETHYLFAGARASHQEGLLPEGLTIVDIRTPPLDRNSVVSRLRYYGGQLVDGTRQAWKAGESDVLVSGLTPSVLSVGPYLAARLRKVPFVLDERDLALDAIAELRIFPRAVVRAAQLVERFVQRRADLVVTVTPGLVQRLRAHGVPRDRIRLVPNGYEGGFGTPPDRALLREQLGWDGRFVVLYAGALGQAYDISLVLDALHHLRRPDLLLALAGEGERKAKYQERARRERVPVQFLEPRPKKDVAALCRAADICVLPLHPVEWSRCSLSNKLFDYLGAGTAIVATGPGDTADLVTQAAAGLTVPAGDAPALAAAIDALASNPARRTAMGEAGRSFVQAGWRRERFTPLFREALRSVADPQAERFRESEVDRIRTVYGYYDTAPREQRKRLLTNPGTQAHAQRRWAAIREAIVSEPLPPAARVLDVGCGAGADLARLSTMFNGASPELHGVDVLPDRIERARRAVPDASFLLQPADQLPFPDDHFHLILASTLFSSILVDGYAESVARELFRVLAPRGRLICYDVRCPNPMNRHTRALSRRLIRRLFPESLCMVRLQSLTLLPPLARRLGRLTPLAYDPLHRIPLLRGHYLAVLCKQPHKDAGVKTA